MFLNGSPYSPFFTSGLLSDWPANNSYCAPSYDLGARRGSLPTSTATSASPSKPVSDHSSNFYFSMQPTRDADEYRSFLSLDLAESQSLMSVSTKKRESQSTTQHWQSSRRVASPSIRTRPSRDSMRTIPSPKPAPKAMLPKVPKCHKRQYSSLSSRVPSPLSSAVRDSFSTSSCDALPPMSPASPKLRRTVTRSTAFSSSTVSTGYRYNNRSDALACLEGRSKSAVRQSSQRLQPNFMNLSDDEEDDDADNEYDSYTDDSDSSRAIYAHSAILLSPAALIEDEDSILRSATKNFSQTHAHSHSLPSLTPSSRKRRRHHSRSSNIDWFPLQSFIDLKNERDDDPVNQWNWRSFIEIAAAV